jgi:hypothetical protein
VMAAQYGEQHKKTQKNTSCGRQGGCFCANWAEVDFFMTVEGLRR